jgi:D-alanyl-D-alanine carboxypeptidase (penicillin-binding protein 5/6)
MLSKIFSTIKYIFVIVPFILLYLAFNIDSIEHFNIKGFLPTEIRSDEDWIEKKYHETLRVYFDADPNWTPGEKFGTSAEPEVIGESALLVDMESGHVLYEKNSTQRREIASLVKIMTAVVALEHKDLNEYITVSEHAASIGENSMGLTTGEAYTLRELMYGLVLASGNDAAYAIAEGVAGNSDAFVEWMNIKGAELGLQNSHFAGPSGLDDSTYSTAEDLVKLTRYAMKNPDFREIVGTVEMELISDSHKYVYLYNQTNLLTSYPGVAGVKTGYTEEAGLCLVTYAQNGGHEVIGVVLDSTDRKGDMILMLDHGFGSVGVVIDHNLL